MWLPLIIGFIGFIVLLVLIGFMTEDRLMSSSNVARGVPARPDEGSPQPPTPSRHLYSAGDVDRVKVVSSLGTIAAIVATGTVLLLALPFPHLGTQLSAWGGVVIAVVLFPLIFAVFDKRAWRWRATALVPHFTIPSLSGQWSGRVVITKGKKGEGVGVPLPCSVQIRQNWSRIAIDFKTEISRSWSVMANVDARRTGDDVQYELHYEYYVIPTPDAPPELAEKLELIDPHYGTTRLVLKPGPWPRVRATTLEGIWYNDQDFERWGNIRLRREA